MGNRLRLPRYRYRYVLVILSLIIYYFSNHPKPLLNRTQTAPKPNPLPVFPCPTVSQTEKAKINRSFHTFPGHRFTRIEPPAPATGKEKPRAGHRPERGSRLFVRIEAGNAIAAPCLHTFAPSVY